MAATGSDPSTGKAYLMREVSHSRRWLMLVQEASLSLMKPFTQSANVMALASAARSAARRGRDRSRQSDVDYPRRRDEGRKGAPRAAEPRCDRGAQGHARGALFRLRVSGRSPRQADRQEHAAAALERDHRQTRDRTWVPVKLPRLGCRAHVVSARGR